MSVTAKAQKTEVVFDAARDAAAIERIVIARIGMLMRAPFFGNVATRLTLQNADTWLPTAATDGRKFYYNSEFIMKLKEREVEFLVGHELLHAVYDHIGMFNRIGDRNPQLFNIACDYAVNRDLVDNRIGEKISTVPVLYDPKYKDMAAEEIYDELFKNAKKINIDDLMKQVLDQHMDGEDGEGEGGPDSLTPEERQAIKDDLKEALLSSAQAVGIGNVPGNMKRFIEGLTEPKMNWKEILTQCVEAQVRNDFTYMKPSRRGWGCDAVLPSMKREPSVEVSLWLDMSGSIGEEEIKTFFSEVKGIVEQHAAFNITVGCWDTQVYNVQTFTEDTVDELMSYEPAGGGGTDANCIFKYWEENEIEPKQAVIFTDGEFHTPTDPMICDNIVWLIKNRHRKEFNIPFGMTLIYED